MEKLLRFVLTHLIRSGSLTVSVAAHPPFTVGDGSGPPLAMHLKTDRAVRRLLRNPDLRIGELYMDGELEIRQGDIGEFLALAMRNYNAADTILPVRLTRWWRRIFRTFAQLNFIGRSRRNVAHHYDLDGRLYKLFLDRDLQYSCAYFENLGAPCTLASENGRNVAETPAGGVPDPDGLEAAQLAKKRHIAAKLVMKPGYKVLDIGSGWGGMALYLARLCGASVTGVTLSREQLGVSQARAQELGVADRAQFALADYRTLNATYDRIVSVGMFEHVGVPWYQVFFDKAAKLLADNGVMLLHAIGRMDGAGSTNPWIARYIFPGGYIPALSEVLPAIERAGLVVTDIEILRLHYAETLKAWRRRFHARRDEVLALFDERFFRMFDFYLAGSEMAFRHDGMMVFQIQLARRQDAVPLTRDYIARQEAMLRRREAELLAQDNDGGLRQAGE
ncbi:cyclopropane-fatty-acyl-phospholipid synthase [Pseudochelatococcus lubricantis]|uniref:Cyclopropane-fatty-acyl-phospholipid synthase n=1 Tax=Pseudochelatococcus lubricantis TaxID=1538102 RepID=A0ABX0V2H6_9HYPH|nr:cyclopropane-fatty-acyl-phospholipid synthase family protein [Pseudochelatococcus lubricantis]NIJ59332.1 cyclopropane-fatty-acyl-phospholipid synthase [Pseudochelatococcus lubricantis]